MVDFSILDFVYSPVLDLHDLIFHRGFAAYRFIFLVTHDNILICLHKSHEKTIHICTLMQSSSRKPSLNYKFRSQIPV